MSVRQKDKPVAVESGGAPDEVPVNVEKRVENVESAVKSAGFSCYIGPNLPGIIQNSAIYPAGKTDAMELPELKLALSRKPEIAGLVVDGSTLAEDRIKVKTPGTPLYQAYRALKKQ